MTHQAPHRISRHHNDQSGTTANLQTPQWPIRYHSESPDTTMTNQVPQRISRHHNDSSGTTENLQTPQWLIRHHSESADTTMTHQAPQRISRHHNDSSDTTANLQTPQCDTNASPVPLFLFPCHPSLPAGTVGSDSTTGRHNPPPFRLSDLHILSTFDDISFSVSYTNYFTQRMHKPRNTKFAQYRVISVGPQCASGAQNFEMSPRFLQNMYTPALHELWSRT